MTLEQRLAEALRLLYDNQNGCPLPKYEKQWNRAMELSESALKEFESTNPLLEFLHEGDCPKYEFHIQHRGGEYRAQCAGCGSDNTTHRTASGSVESSQDDSNRILAKRHLSTRNGGLRLILNQNPDFLT